MHLHGKDQARVSICTESLREIEHPADYVSYLNAFRSNDAERPVTSHQGTQPFRTGGLQYPLSEIHRRSEFLRPARHRSTLWQKARTSPMLTRCPRYSTHPASPRHYLQNLRHWPKREQKPGECVGDIHLESTLNESFKYLSSAKAMPCTNVRYGAWVEMRPDAVSETPTERYSVIQKMAGLNETLT